MGGKKAREEGGKEQTKKAGFAKVSAVGLESSPSPAAPRAAQLPAGGEYVLIFM